MSSKPEKTTPALPVTGHCAPDPATATLHPAVRKTPIDIKVLAGLARMTHSLSPMSLTLAGIDWAGHLAFAPGKRLELFSMGVEHMQNLWQTALQAGAAAESETSGQARPPLCRPGLAAVAV